MKNIGPKLPPGSMCQRWEGVRVHPPLEKDVNGCIGCNVIVATWWLQFTGLSVRLCQKCFDDLLEQMKNPKDPDEEQMKEPVDEKVTTTTVLNPIIEVIDLDTAFCPNCGPNHLLYRQGKGVRDDLAWCEECDWSGTCGNLMDLFASLDDDEEE